MKRKIAARIRTACGDTLVYALLRGDDGFGVEIVLCEEGKTTVRRCENLFCRRSMAYRFLRELKKEQVYPVHLKQIVENYEFNRL